MAATARRIELLVIPGGRSIASRPDPRVVAEILDDGTIRTGTGVVPRARDDRQDGWATTSISGSDWVIWLERRSWKPKEESGS